MALHIELPETYPLNANNEGVVLPEILLKPTEDNWPHLKQLTFGVSGEPHELVQAIQAAYQELLLPEPRKLTGNASLTRKSVAGPLPDQLEVVLQVEAHYYDSDAVGNPVGPGTRRHAGQRPSAFCFPAAC